MPTDEFELKPCGVVCCDHLVPLGPPYAPRTEYCQAPKGHVERGEPHYCRDCRKKSP